MGSTFGTAFASKIAVAHYRDGAWSDHALEPLRPLALHPAAHVLHYASTCFEGLKAYRWADGSVHIFRLDRHAQRMQQSARMLCLPVPGTERLEEMVCELVADCREGIPALPGALYLRPLLIGTQASVGGAAAGSEEATLLVLASPVGDYFAGGPKPLRILVEDRRARSSPDFGQVKTGGNYAAALRHILDAREKYGADQVLFCPGGEVQETGAANFLLIDDREILTKRLDGAILHGVTRDSLLRLAPELGYRVDERDFNVAELLERAPRGEAALSGTAAVLATVGELVYRGDTHRVGDGSVGRNTRRLRTALTDIQGGRAPDAHGWLRRV